MEHVMLHVWFILYIVAWNIQGVPCDENLARKQKVVGIRFDDGVASFHENVTQRLLDDR